MPLAPLYGRSALALALAVAVAGASAELRAPVYSDFDALPAKVRADYVITPSGLFHKSCIEEAPDGGSILQDGIYDKNGALVKKHQPCRYPSFVHLPGQPTRVIQPDNPVDELVSPRHTGG